MGDELKVQFIRLYMICIPTNGDCPLALNVENAKGKKGS